MEHCRDIQIYVAKKDQMSFLGNTRRMLRHRKYCRDKSKGIRKKECRDIEMFVAKIMR